MKIYDLSVNINSNMLKWPSDPKIKVDKVSSIENGDIANVSSLSMGSHTGTHIDAPYHFNINGKKVDEIDLNDLIGTVLVVEVYNKKSIDYDDIKELELDKYKRIIFKTDNTINGLMRKEEFDERYVSLDISAAEFLVQHNVKVVGIDYLSIESYTAKVPEVHRLLTKNNVIIIEGLNLSEVDSGEYLLIAMPIKIKGCDGAPSRIALIKDYEKI